MRPLLEAVDEELHQGIELTFVRIDPFFDGGVVSFVCDNVVQRLSLLARPWDHELLPVDIDEHGLFGLAPSTVARRDGGEAKTHTLSDGRYGEAMTRDISSASASMLRVYFLIFQKFQTIIIVSTLSVFAPWKFG